RPRSAPRMPTYAGALAAALTCAGAGLTARTATSVGLHRWVQAIRIARGRIGPRDDQVPRVIRPSGFRMAKPMLLLQEPPLGDAHDEQAMHGHRAHAHSGEHSPR
ncbi:hypothetical protein EV714DRAFT_207937, partial [Schizophyllum commune]